MNDEYIRWNKAISKYKSNSRIRRCFHFDNENCADKIKSAHSLQRNGVLNLLEKEIKGNRFLYSLGRPKFVNPFRFYGFEKIGRRTASTFDGFCDLHDSQVFSPIENKKFDPENTKHLFLVSYRAYAKEYHAKIELKKASDPNNGIINKSKGIESFSFQTGSSLVVKEMTIEKKRLNEMLKNEDYTSLEYMTYSIEYLAPIACSATVSPYFTYLGKRVNDPKNSSNRFQRIMITVLPSVDETHIVLACFREDDRSLVLMEELDNMDDRHF